MFTVKKYPHGTFSWADLSTSNVAASKKFYTEVMDWEAEDLPLFKDVNFTRFKKDGENVAALLPLYDKGYEENLKSHWKCFITVNDVDALADKVTDLGGTILEKPADVLDDGRLMIVREPTGVKVTFWQAKKMIGAGLVNTVGAMLWNEFRTRDPQTMMDFFASLLGWEFQQDGERNYHMIFNKGRVNGGIMKMGDIFGDMPPHSMVYYNVADLDLTLKKVTDLGGAVHVLDEAGVGKMAVISDPQGARLAVMQAENPQPWDVD